MELRISKEQTSSSKLISLISEIKEMPQLFPSSYIPNKWENRINLQYKMYSYSQIFSSGKETLMNNFNTLLKDYIQQLIDIKKLWIIISNIEDKKTFNLSENLVDRLQLL